jgi:hypothetical protein
MIQVMVADVSTGVSASSFIPQTFSSLRFTTPLEDGSNRTQAVRTGNFESQLMQMISYYS